MRTSPPVLPTPPDDAPPARGTWLDHPGSDSALRGKAVGYGVRVAGVTFGARFILSLLGGVP